MSAAAGKLTSVGGDTWDSATARGAPRPAAMRLLQRQGTFSSGAAHTPAGSGTARASSSSGRGPAQSSGSSQRATGLGGVLPAVPSERRPQGPSTSSNGSGVAPVGAGLVGNTPREAASPKLDTRSRGSRRTYSPSAVPAPSGGGGASSSTTPPALARDRSSRAMAAERSSGADATNGGMSPPPASQPFQRTATNARRSQMSQALKFSSMASTSKDNFMKKNHSAMVNGHRQTHMANSGSSRDVGDGAEMTEAKALANSAVARQAFLDALKHGKVKPRTLKLMFVGQGRAGKTSTLKALTGRAFDSEEVSTHGLHSAMPLVQSVGGGVGVDVALVSQWKVLDKPEHEVHGLELERSYAQYIADRLLSGDGDAGDTSPSSRDASAVAGASDTYAEDDCEDPRRIPHNARMVNTKLPVDLVAKIIESDGNEEPEPIKLKTWDFGGQREYYVMHHIFLTNRGIYLVITRLDAWLRDGDLDGPPDPGSDVDEAFEPPLEALTFWLSSIHVHAPDAIIIIVGTHADKVAACREEAEARVEHEITRLMERVPGVERQIVINDAAGLCFFPVDNSRSAGSGDESGHQALRACIDRVASEALTPGGCFGEELPLCWVQLREALEDAAEGTTGDDGVLPITASFVLSLAKVRELAQEVDLADEADLVDCLQYLHNVGSIVFFNEDGLRDHVVLNTQWLADAMAHVLNCPRVVQGGVAAARRLREKGELEDDLLRRHLWKAHKFRQHHEVLLRILYRFDLIIPTASTSATNPVHVVPCLLPNVPESVAEPHGPAMPACYSELFFDFHGLLCRLLPTIFPKLVVASARRPDIDIMSALGLYRDSFRLLWMNKELVMDLVPRERPQVVRVRAVASHGFDGASDDLSPAVARGLLELLQVTLAQHNHLTFTAGVLCEHCHARGRSQSERHHVIDVNEMLSEKHVVCRVSARVVAVPLHSWIGRWRAEALSQTAASRPGSSPSPSPSLPKIGLRCESVFGEDRRGSSAGFGEYWQSDIDDSVRSPQSSHVRVRPQSPAPTVTTESSLDVSSVPTAISTSRSGASGAGPLHPRAVPPVHLLYASPLWQDGEQAGELPPLDIAQEANLLVESTNTASAASASVASVVGGNGISALPLAPPVLRAEPATTANLQRLLMMVTATVPAQTAGDNLMEHPSQGHANLQSLLPVVLHLSLHCADAGQQLLLEDDNGGTHQLPVQDLVALLTATGGAERLGLVFINACCSEFAGKAFVVAGAPHVVCCRGAVFDATARCFTRAFYLALYAGSKSIGQAFEIARTAIRTTPQVGLRGEAHKYILLPEDGAHNTTLSEWLHHAHGRNGGLSKSTMIAACPSSSSAGLNGLSSPITVSPFAVAAAVLPHRVEDFCGRAREIWLLMQHLGSGRRCIVVWGAAQVGKSALLAELARFAGAPGRRYGGRTVRLSLSSEELQFDDPSEKSGVGLAVALLKRLESAVQRVCKDYPLFEPDLGDDVVGLCSQAADKRFIICRITQLLHRIEAGGHTLLVIDDLDVLLADTTASDELQKFMREILLRTEKVVIVLSARVAAFQSLNPHKVVAFRLETLRPLDAARLFLWRVHRPLGWTDLSEAAGEAAQGLPLIINAQNRGLVLSRLAGHPLMQQCDGNPGRLRAAADRVLPGGGTLWDLCRSEVHLPGVVSSS